MSAVHKSAVNAVCAHLSAAPHLWERKLEGFADALHLVGAQLAQEHGLEGLSRQDGHSQRKVDQQRQRHLGGRQIDYGGVELLARGGCNGR